MFFYYIFKKNLEKNVKDYIKKNKGQEVFLGLIGKIKGKRKEEALFIYEIEDIIAFPNVSNNPKLYAVVTDSWYDILFENIQFRQDPNRTPLGILHSHVKGRKEASDVDIKFMSKFSNKLNRFIMIIFSYSPSKGFRKKAYILIRKDKKVKIFDCLPYSEA